MLLHKCRLNTENGGFLRSGWVGGWVGAMPYPPTRGQRRAGVLFNLIPANVEAVCLEVTRPKSKPILITSVYRPPNSRIELLNELETLFQNLDSEHKEQIIVGDFNCDLLRDNLNNPQKDLMR